MLEQPYSTCTGDKVRIARVAYWLSVSPWKLEMFGFVRSISCTSRNFDIPYCRSPSDFYPMTSRGKYPLLRFLLAMSCLPASLAARDHYMFNAMAKGDTFVRAAAAHPVVFVKVPVSKVQAGSFCSGSGLDACYTGCDQRLKPSGLLRDTRAVDVECVPKWMASKALVAFRGHSVQTGNPRPSLHSIFVILYPRLYSLYCKSYI